MTDRDLYRQKQQAQMDQWKAELAVLRARAQVAGADARIEMQKQLDGIEHTMHETGLKLADLAASSEEAWGAVKDSLDTAAGSLKNALADARARFKH